MTESPPNTIRATLERLLELDSKSITLRSKQAELAWAAACKAARAALAAEPVGEGPSAAKLIGLALGREPWATWLRSGGCLELAHCELADLMLAVLARWGRPAAPPAPEPGEVGELVAFLREQLHECLQIPWTPGIKHFGRAATLLQQLSAPAPAVAPVAIPGEQWHEDDGACLWWRFPIEEPPWSGDPRGDDWPGYHTHFTPIVCPLPQGGEGEA